MATLLQEENVGPRGMMRVMRMRLTYADAPTAGTATFTFPELPAGTLLYDVINNTKVVFNSGASDALELGDGTDADEYCVSTNLQALANGTMVGGGEDDAPPHVLEADTTLTLTLTSAGAAATTGQTEITVIYAPCNV